MGAMPGRRERPSRLVEMTVAALMIMMMVVVCCNASFSSASIADAVSTVVMPTAVANGSDDSCFGLPDNTTEIKGTVTVPSGTKINCTGDLRLVSNSTLRCTQDPDSDRGGSDIEPGPPSLCSISISANTIDMENSSAIVAGKVNITCSTLNIATKAKVDTTARSLYKPPKPLSSEFNAIGGSHGGYGKSCWDKKVEVNKECNYVSGWNMIDGPTDPGGAGFNSLPSNATNTTVTDGGYGGGVVYINASKKLCLFGSILSNGGDSTGGGGGAGGSIFIITDTICGVENSVFRPSSEAMLYSTISASGGKGNGPNSGGGSGGRVALQASRLSTTKFNVVASGGSSQGCAGCGAAGTQYTTINGVSTLTISNSECFSDAITPIGCGSKGDIWIRTSVKKLAISDAAVVQCVAERVGGGLSRFSILNGASFSMELPDTAEGCSIFLDSDDGQLSIASSTVKITGNVEASICTKYLGLDSSSSITAGPRSSGGAGTSQEPTNSNFTFRINAANFEMTRGSSLSLTRGVLDMTGSMQTFSIKDPSTVVSASQIVADNTGLQLEIGQGAVLQTKGPPDYPTVFSDTFCPSDLSQGATEINPVETCRDLKHDDFYMIRLTHLQGVSLSGEIRTGYLILEKVGSLTIYETGSISAKALGCPPNTGVGRGQKSYTGAGGGGGYGGVGGNGTFNGTVSVGGVAYGNKTLDGCVVGSGGGSSASEQSGSGGGTIIISVAHYGDLTLNGTIDADGESLNDQNSLAEPGTPTVPGGGAGSGGTIILTMYSLIGQGMVSANGGQGRPAGGGGGGGGRIVFNWLSDDRFINLFNGTLTVAGGEGSDDATSGGNGTAIALNCKPGRAGAFCSPCPPGTYGTKTEAAKCLPCKNAIPQNAYYSDHGVNSSSCPYQCFNGYHGHYCSKRRYSSLSKWSNLSSLFQDLAALIVITVILFVIIFSSILVSMSASNLKRPETYKWIYPEKEKYRESSDQMNSAYFLDSLEEVMRKDKMKTVQDQYLFRFRIIMEGDNSFHHPWKLSTQLPDELQDVAIEESYVEFATYCNSLTIFLWWEGSVYGILSFLLPPAARLWLQWRRFIRSKKLESFVSLEYRHTFLRSCRARALRDGISFHSSPGNSFACIEILLRDDDMRGKYNTTSTGLDIRLLQGSEFPKENIPLSDESSNGAYKTNEKFETDSFLDGRASLSRKSVPRSSAMQEDDEDDHNRFGNSRMLTLLSPFTFFFVGDGDLLHPYSLEIREDRSSLLGNQISFPVLRRIIAGINLRILQGLLTRPFTRGDSSGLEEVQDFMDSIVKRTLLKRGFLCELFLFSLDKGNDCARPAWIVLNEESPLLSQIASDAEEKPSETSSETSRGSTESLGDRTREFSLSLSFHDFSDDEDPSSIAPLLKDKSFTDKDHMSKLSSPDSNGAILSPLSYTPPKRISDWVENLDFRDRSARGSFSRSEKKDKTLPPDLLMRAVKHRVFMSKDSSLLSIKARGAYLKTKGLLKLVRTFAESIPKSSRVIPKCVFRLWKKHASKRPLPTSQQQQLVYAIGFALLIFVLADLFFLIVSFANLVGGPLVFLIIPNIFPLLSLLLSPIAVLAALMSREEAAGRLSLWANSFLSWSLLPVLILLGITLSLNKSWSIFSDHEGDVMYTHHIFHQFWIFVPALLFLCKWLQLGFLSSFVILNMANDLTLLSDDFDVFWT